MHRQSEPRAGNHQRHTRTRNASLHCKLTCFARVTGVLCCMVGLRWWTSISGSSFCLLGLLLWFRIASVCSTISSLCSGPSHCTRTIVCVDVVSLHVWRFLLWLLVASACSNITSLCNTYTVSASTCLLYTSDAADE